LDHREAEHHIDHLSRIRVCTDFSGDAERALDYAISVTGEYDAEITLLHVVEQVPNHNETEEVIATTKEELDKLILAEERKTLKLGTVVRIGKPYQRIVGCGQEVQSNSVTMGVRGSGALHRAVFGSTTYRVILLGSCTVLVVHV
jgi:nucleotide-binding universal stress UspA family protein